MKWTNVLAYEVNSGGGNIDVQPRLWREGRFGWLWPFDSFHITQQGFCTCVAFSKGSFLSFFLFLFLSFFLFFFLQQKRVKANKNTRRTCMFLILFFKHYRHMHRAVQVRRELKWHSFVFSKKKKKNIEQVTGIQRHLEEVGNILRLYKALPDVL